MTAASGKSVTMRARWSGSLPEIGDYLMSQTRPRWAYRIVLVTVVGVAGERPVWTAPLEISYRLKIKAKRVRPSLVPEAATVHPWRWDARGRNRAGKAM